MFRSTELSKDTNKHLYLTSSFWNNPYNLEPASYTLTKKPNNQVIDREEYLRLICHLRNVETKTTRLLSGAVRVLSGTLSNVSHLF